MRSAGRPSLPSAARTSSTYPSRFSTSATERTKREERTSTTDDRTRIPLRIRVNMSAMGSVLMGLRRLLPRGLADAGDLAAERHRAEAQAARTELPVVRAPSPAELAAVVAPRRELRLALLLDDQAGPSHGRRPPRARTGTRTPRAARGSRR